MKLNLAEKRQHNIQYMEVQTGQIGSREETCGFDMENNWQQMYIKNPRMLPSTGNQNSNTNRHLAPEDIHDGFSALCHPEG